MIKRIVLLLLVSAITVFAVDAKIEVVKKGQVLPKIVVQSAQYSQYDIVEKIKNVIAKDLKVSGHFDVQQSKIKTAFKNSPDYLALGNKGIDLYANLEVEMKPLKGISLKIKLFDINKRELMFNKTISSKLDNRYPFLGHRASILINKHMNAPSIDWMDKFVIFSVYKNAKQADIMIGDYTLAFQKTIVKGGLNIFPKWAGPDQKSFYYTTYNSGEPKLVKLNLYNGQRQTIMKSQGMVVASDVNSDGSKILITASPYGQPDVYLYDLRTKIKSRLTNYKGIDVGAHFVENDSKIVFVSDRLKYPNIFAKKIGSRGVERLVYHGRNNSSATTHKNFVVYTSREGSNEFSYNTFNLYLISTQSDFIRRLTSNGVNQFPKFSTDGESILYIKRARNRSYVGIIRLNQNRPFLFELKSKGKIQSIDW